MTHPDDDLAAAAAAAIHAWHAWSNMHAPPPGGLPAAMQRLAAALHTHQTRQEGGR
jgi:hypothetical protein